MTEQPRERGLRARLRDAWQDVQESTDAALLTFPRFIGLLYGPIARSLPFGEAFKKSLSYRLPAHVGWRHALGGITYLLFMILIVTGVLLSFYYRPSVSEAYPSMQHIVSRVPMGWLVRDLHVWSASLIVVVALLHMGRVFFAGAYRRPRETNWLVGLFLLLLIAVQMSAAVHPFVLGATQPVLALFEVFHVIHFTKDGKIFLGTHTHSVNFIREIRHMGIEPDDISLVDAYRIHQLKLVANEQEVWKD